MFEAHYLVQPDSPALFDTPESGLTRRLRSHRHQCPLHAWAVPGKRKDDSGTPRPRWFIYIEYCRPDGARDWETIEKPRCQDLDALFDQARWLELPDIDPQRTTSWLDAEDAGCR